MKRNSSDQASAHTSRQDQAAGVLPILLFLAWAFFLLVGYYYYHKPVTPPLALALFQNVWRFSISFAVIAASAGLGRWLLKRWVDINNPTTAVMEAALGLGLIALAWLGLGLAGLMHPLAAWVVLIGLLLVFRRSAWSWLSQLKHGAATWTDWGRLEKISAWIAAVLVFLQLLAALAPPLKWDALTYHLELPRRYAAAGGLVFIPQNPYSGQPQLVEILYTWATLLDGPETASLLGWWSGVLVLLGVYGVTTLLLAARSPKDSPAPQPRWPVQSAGVFAAAALLAGQSFRHMLGWAYTDLFTALFGICALAAFLRWQASQAPAWFRWTGVFIGLAVSVKWTAGVFAVAAAAGALLVCLWQGITRARLALLVQGGALAVLVYLPWLVRALVATGNPFFPFLFATPWYSLARLAAANTPPASPPVLKILALPVSLTWSGVEGSANFDADIGPLLVMFAAVGLWIYRRDRRILLPVLGLLAAWLSMLLAGLRFGHLLQPRLYFVVLPGLAVLAGLGWNWVQAQTGGGVRLRRVAGSLVMLVLGLALIQDGVEFSARSTSRVLLGIDTRERYLEENLGFYGVVMNALPGELDGSSRVLFLWEPRGLYAPLASQPDPWIDRFRSDRLAGLGSSAMLSAWRSEGFTHLLVNQQGMEFMRAEDANLSRQDWENLDSLLGRLPKQLMVGDQYALYRLDSIETP